jgi:CDP-2,3-bis-(O-geranylgeranyl)-sn-glycerol synthase
MSDTLNTGLDAQACAAFIVVAFVLAGIAHVLWLRSKVSRRFAFPMDGGHSLHGHRIFGDHKMIRGFMVMIPAAGVAFGLLFLLIRTAAPEVAARLWPQSPLAYCALGLLAGLGFMAGELPNSFIKRQLGIEPGGIPVHPVLRAVFLLADRVDSIAGMLLSLSLAVSVPAWTFLYVVSFGIGIHWIFSAVLFAFGVKERRA